MILVAQVTRVFQDLLTMFRQIDFEGLERSNLPIVSFILIFALAESYKNCCVRSLPRAGISGMKESAS